MVTDPPPVVRSSAGKSAALPQLAVATIGFAATFSVWASLASLAPELTDRFALDPLALGLLVGVPLAIGSLGRFPVGVLTDHYGARLTLPAVAVTAAVPLAAAAFVTTVPALIAVALAFGVAGTTFAAGTALVSRCYPRWRRGWALGVFGTGMAGTAVAGLTSGQLNYPHEHRTVLPLAALALVLYAAIAAVLIRDESHRDAGVPVSRAALAALRMPVVPRLATLYAAAFGTLVAAAMYLPAYLRVQYGTTRDEAMLLTVTAIIVAAALRSVGGAMADRHASAWVLSGGFGLAAACALVQAFAPPLPLGVSALVGMAIGLGGATGALHALIGIVSPANRVGAVAGAVGAAGGLGGLILPLLLAAVYAIDHSFAIGMTILSALLLAAASMRTDGLTSAERVELAWLRQENRRLRTDLEMVRHRPRFFVAMPDEDSPVHPGVSQRSSAARGGTKASPVDDLPHSEG